MHRGAPLRLSALALALAGCGGEDIELPPVIAGSQYIAYRTDADASVICMDDLLAREDRFLERTAALLGVSPPTRTIDFVWDPVHDGTEPWACPSGAHACYMYRAGDDLSLVVSPTATQHHELVHAIEQQALGGGSHPILREGLAEYLGTLSPSIHAPEGFPARFKAMFTDVLHPGNYQTSMHFVGALFARHGVEKYRALRAAMPKYAGLDQFAAVFEGVLGQSLDDALVEMAGDPVFAIDEFRGCAEGEAPALEWTGEGLLDTTIEAACGDPWFYGAGAVDGRPSFFGLYRIDVPEAGLYALTVTGVDGESGALRGGLGGCSFTVLGSGVLSLAGETGEGLLQRGQHSLGIGFPPHPEARGEVRVQLEYIGPPP